MLEIQEFDFIFDLCGVPLTSLPGYNILIIIFISEKNNNTANIQDRIIQLLKSSLDLNNLLVSKSSTLAYGTSVVLLR
jgi:hypothetical protein